MGVISFEYMEFTAIGYGTGPNVGTLLTGSPKNDHRHHHINFIFNAAGYVTVAQSDYLKGFGHSDNPFYVLSHAVHPIEYACGVGSHWKINACHVDLERKKIAGAFTIDHMFHYLQLARYFTHSCTCMSACTCAEPHTLTCQHLGLCTYTSTTKRHSQGWHR